MQKVMKNIYSMVFIASLLALLSSAPLANNMEGKVDINRATLNQLQQLDGIGKTIAERIIAFRNTHGPFETIDKVKKVRGIGEKTFEKIEPYIEVGRKQPLAAGQ